MEGVIKKLIKVVEAVMGVMVGVIVIVIALQVIFRYALKEPLDWSEQVARYFFIWICMLGIPVATWRGATFSFDMVAKKLPEKPQVVIRIMINLINMFFCAYWIYWSVVIIEKAGWRITLGVPVKMAYLYGAQVACGALLFIVIAGETVSAVKKFYANKEVDR